MKFEARVGERGEIVIPEDVRAELRLEPQMKVAVQVTALNEPVKKIVQDLEKAREISARLRESYACRFVGRRLCKLRRIYRRHPRQMITAVDTNILFDLLAGSGHHRPLADRAFGAAGVQGVIVISSVVYAEVSGRFSDRIELDSFLESLGRTVEPLDASTAYLAGIYFKEYRRRGGERTRILPDFLIAAHAELNAGCILTRDGRFFGGSFPNLVAVGESPLLTDRFIYSTVLKAIDLRF